MRYSQNIFKALLGSVCLLLVSCNPIATESTLSDDDDGNGGEKNYLRLQVTGLSDADAEKIKTVDLTDKTKFKAKISKILSDDAPVPLMTGNFGVQSVDPQRQALSLPNIDSNGNGRTEYAVYVVALDDDDEDFEGLDCAKEKSGSRVVCSTNTTVAIGDVLRPAVEEDSANLLEMITADGSISLFADQFKDVFWKSNSNDSKRLELFLYEAATDIAFMNNGKDISSDDDDDDDD